MLVTENADVIATARNFFIRRIKLTTAPFKLAQVDKATAKHKLHCRRSVNVGRGRRLDA